MDPLAGWCEYSRPPGWMSQPKRMGFSTTMRAPTNPFGWGTAPWMGRDGIGWWSALSIANGRPLGYPAWRPWCGGKTRLVPAPRGPPAPRLSQCGAPCRAQVVRSLQAWLTVPLVGIVDNQHAVLVQAGAEPVAG